MRRPSVQIPFEFLKLNLTLAKTCSKTRQDFFLVLKLGQKVGFLHALHFFNAKILHYC